MLKWLLIPAETILSLPNPVARGNKLDIVSFSGKPVVGSVEPAVKHLPSSLC